MTTQADKIEEIYNTALSKKEGAERSAYLDSACGNNERLRKRVEVLLELAEEVGEFLETPPPFVDAPFLHQFPAEAPGTVIGPYKLLERIGEGGMAVVYMAEQQEPIRRKVALKIIKLGMDTKEVIARFEAERQALAMMDHPNIAKVLDAGATETGRPYFVMELVTGISITEYCDKNNLTTRARLDLFLQVCSAVQHAHQKGIIHRDIKPTNVMVTHVDGRPVPKVIDFGIAKAINQRLTEKTLFTRYAHIIGTPAYMSPEQAEMNDVDIDARTDIYSLGVLLYELLTGNTPFSEEELRKAGYLEMQRIIRETDPLKPSTKLSTMGDALTGIAEHRKTNPDLLAKLIRGDLDWIAMKSLEKDRARRYETVNSLARDIQRHLEHRPVLAHAPTTAYRLRKFLRRHRSQVVAAIAFVFVAGTITILSIRNRYQVRLAEAEGARQVNALSEARNLIEKGDLAAAHKIIRPLLESEHAGLAARTIFAGLTVDSNTPAEVLKGTETIMDRHYRERVEFYSEKIQANPVDANNYLQRAQQYHYLHEGQNVYADMRTYADILGWAKSLDLIFGTPVNLKAVAPILDPASDVIDCFSLDGLEMYIQSERPGGYGWWDLWVSRRASVNEGWRPLENLGAIVNSPSNETTPSISADGLTLYFSSQRPGGYGSADIYMTMRVTRDAPWGQPVNMGPKINSDNADLCPWISADGLELYFESYLRAGGYGGDDIYVTRRATTDEPWGEPVNLGPVVNSKYEEHGPSLSPDGLLMFFSDRDLFQNMPRPGGYGYCDIWVTRRANPSDTWQTPVNLGPQVNGTASDVMPRISPNGNMFYFCSNRAGNWNNYKVPIVSSKADFKLDDDVQSAKKSVESDDGEEVEP